MKIVEPNVFLVGETKLNKEGFDSFLNEIGVPNWFSDGKSEAEVIVEGAGKLCYMSFDTSLNQNLTKTGTRTNFDYIQEGLIGQKHTSVLEHVSINLVLTNVSRVFTHELVRHRPGAAYSQTSGRYVRTDELSFWIPSCIKENPALEVLFTQAIIAQEVFLREMVKVAGLDEMTGRGDFAKKKVLTSAFRRIIGNGVANHIEATYNHRALRHIIAMRTSRHAEEEIRLVFNKVYGLVRDRYPAIYADAKATLVDGHYEIKFSDS